MAKNYLHKLEKNSQKKEKEKKKLRTDMEASGIEETTHTWKIG